MFKLCEEDVITHSIKGLFEVNENREIDLSVIQGFENIFRKTKRLRLVEVIFLLKQITNMEMDLRFEAAAASELRENTLNDKGIKVPKIYWNFTSKKIRGSNGSI